MAAALFLGRGQGVEKLLAFWWGMDGGWSGRLMTGRGSSMAGVAVRSQDAGRLA